MNFLTIGQYFNKLQSALLLILVVPLLILSTLYLLTGGMPHDPRPEYFIIMVGLLLAGLLWPTSRKVSVDLKLRGDEREMVYYKKDTF